MRIKELPIEQEEAMVRHIELLGHKGFGVSELRVFKPRPMVAYVDNIKDAICLVRDMVGYAHGIYIGVQPRPVDFFDKAPNRWVNAVSSCACDSDIEYITACFWDIDVVSKARNNGHPASEEELLESLDVANCLSGKEGLVLTSTICLSGNGHYVLTPIVPIEVDGPLTSDQFRYFCHDQAKNLSINRKQVKLDPVYNLSRVMRLMGTSNLKGVPIKGRPHRIANFVAEPVFSQSLALHYMILNTEVSIVHQNHITVPNFIKCDLQKIEKCDFIKWCRDYPQNVTEPLWFALATNLARLEGGSKLFHQISSLDEHRYNYQQAQRLLERILKSKYNAVSCENLKSRGYDCQRINDCIAKAPMFLGYLYVKWDN